MHQSLGLIGGGPLTLGAAPVTIATMSSFVGAVLLDEVRRKSLLRMFGLLKSLRSAMSRRDESAEVTDSLPG